MVSNGTKNERTKIGLDATYVCFCLCIIYLFMCLELFITTSTIDILLGDLTRTKFELLPCPLHVNR